MLDEREPVCWQHPLDKAPKSGWDVIIAGAGPAGGIAALHLTRLGHRVLLLDKQRFPRDKTCGDALLSDALRVLDRAGLLEQVCRLGHLVHTASVFSPSRIECAIPGRYLTLRRRVLDALIARKAVDQGAVFCQGEVKRMTVAEHGTVECTLAHPERVYRARVGVIATGARVDLIQRLDQDRPPRASAVAARCYVRSPACFAPLVVSYDRPTVPGYAWIFPMGNQEYNVGCAFLDGMNGRSRTNLKSMFSRFTTEFPLAKELLKGSESVSPLCGALLRCGLQIDCLPETGNILAIGEAIGTTLPSSGEGIGKAMETAELAAQVISQALRSADLHYLRSYPARLEEKLRVRYQGFQAAERWISRPWLNDLVTWRASKSRFVRESLTGILDETVDPRTVFSLRGVLQSFVR